MNHELPAEEFERESLLSSIPPEVLSALLDNRETDAEIIKQLRENEQELERISTEFFERMDALPKALEAWHEGWRSLLEWRDKVRGECHAKASKLIEQLGQNDDKYMQVIEKAIVALKEGLEKN
ncbi:MAG: hypothetical protein Q7R65_04940 [bacterium]|nr:hypothetical protein [bacterium]